MAEAGIFLKLHARILALVQQNMREFHRHVHAQPQEVERLAESIHRAITSSYNTRSPQQDFMPWVLKTARIQIRKWQEDRIEKLMLDARLGDAAVEAQLFSWLRAEIEKKIHPRISNGSMNPEELKKTLEDLTQESCAVVAAKYKTAEFGKDFFAFVFQTVWYVVGDYYRKKNRRWRIFTLRPIDHDSDPPVEAVLKMDPESKAILALTISRALRRLSRKCRKLMQAWLQEKAGIIIDEQTKPSRLGKNYPQISRCKARFRELLIEEGFEP